MKKAVEKENDLYPIVEKWLKKKEQFCFKTAKDTGLRYGGIDYGRIDVVGVRDVGGDLSGEIETIAVEVKEGSERFTTASGQAVGYKIYANRTYLAIRRDEPFLPDHINIASNLGIGLIQIGAKGCKEVLSSPYYKPIDKANLLLLENLGFGKCQMCGCFWEVGMKLENTTSENLKKAIAQEKGVRFWNREVNQRKRRVGIQTAKNGKTFERRFVCPDCVCRFFSQFKLE